MTLIILAGLSTLLNILHPLTAGFLISVLALANGAVEWRGAGNLRALRAEAPRLLSLNQLVLGAGIMGYAAWQAWTLQPDVVLRMLNQPGVRDLLEAFPSEQRQLLLQLLPTVVQGMYVIIGVVGGLGCGASAFYYATRRKYVDVVAATRR